ncbi:MAG: hypothetical protein MUO58_08000 [Anaerolineales bacterium]|nr:hypothetical protein [Anaerolineales bacterium]
MRELDVILTIYEASSSSLPIPQMYEWVLEPVFGVDNLKMGLQIISERVKRVNGGVEIDSHPESGTRIMVRVPLHSGVGGLE